MANRHIPDIYPEVVIGGSKMEKFASIEFFGVSFDVKIKFSTHCREIGVEISMGVGSLHAVEPYVTDKILKLLYHRFIYPYQFCGMGVPVFLTFNLRIYC